MSIVRMFSSNLPSSYNETRKFKFFSTSSLISWANTFETQEFRPKIEIFHKHSKFIPMSIVRMFSSNLPSSYNEASKFKFFSTSSLISWANTFETQEFRPKIEIVQKHSKICRMSIMRSLHHTVKLENSIFFSTSSLISWANTFETQEFRPKIEFVHKLKIYPNVYSKNV